MTVEQEIQNKIRELINNVNQAIPVDWDELYINCEMSETGGMIYFFFKLNNEKNLHYSLLIPKDFQVNKDIFENLDNKTYDIARELWNIFKDNGMEAWRNFSLIYKDKKLQTSFDYIDWNCSKFSPNDRLEFFLYKYANILPIDDEQAHLFKTMINYQAEYGQGN
ncbi:immunity protein YezG family protein [Streptococcus suis]